MRIDAPIVSAVGASLKTMVKDKKQDWGGMGG